MARCRVSLLAAAVVLLVLHAVPSTAAAQGVGVGDPAGVVGAYSAALNSHDLDSALALFDEYGSATDLSGHHFEGRAGLADFLLSSGFGNPGAQISTVNLHVVANRAMWTYRCSCAAAAVDVRMVLNHGKISVFAMLAPPAPPSRRADAGALPWLIGLALIAAALIGGLGLRRERSEAPLPRATQGQLLAALVQARAGQGYTVGGAASERVELPAAAMTSLSNSEDRATP